MYEPLHTHIACKSPTRDTLFHSPENLSPRASVPSLYRTSPSPMTMRVAIMMMVRMVMLSMTMMSEAAAAADDDDDADDDDMCW